MTTGLFVLVAIFVAVVAVAFYMDWLGLWVSKDELKKEVERAKQTRESQETGGGMQKLIGDAARDRR